MTEFDRVKPTFGARVARVERGAQVAAAGCVRAEGVGWVVASPSGKTYRLYAVAGGGPRYACTCDAFRYHPEETCKHGYAVEIVRYAEQGAYEALQAGHLHAALQVAEQEQARALYAHAYYGHCLTVMIRAYRARIMEGGR